MAPIGVTALAVATLGVATGLVAVPPAEARAAGCYARRYPDLERAYCGRRQPGRGCRGRTGVCDSRRAQDHYLEHGIGEGRVWGCGRGCDLRRVQDHYLKHGISLCGEANETALPRAGCPEPKAEDSVVVLVRVLYEQPYLAGFVAWYEALGVECVLIIREGIDDVGDAPDLPAIAVQRLSPSWVHENSIVQATMPVVRATGYKWVLVVDADEYLALSPEFASLPAYVAAQRARVPRLAAVQFVWAMAESLSRACPDRYPFSSFRGNIHVKTLARVDSVARWQNPHAPQLALRAGDCPRGARACAVAMCGGRVVSATLRGHEYVLPFFTTPGITSSTARSAPFSDYADAAMVHVIFRSVINVLVKACGAYSKKRHLADAGGLRALAMERGRPLDLERFVAAAGIKALQLFSERGCRPGSPCRADGRVPLNLAHLRWDRASEPRPSFCNATREREIATRVVSRAIRVEADDVDSLCARAADAIRDAIRPPDADAAANNSRPNTMKRDTTPAAAVLFLVMSSARFQSRALSLHNGWCRGLRCIFFTDAPFTTTPVGMRVIVQGEQPHPAPDHCCALRPPDFCLPAWKAKLAAQYRFLAALAWAKEPYLSMGTDWFAIVDDDSYVWPARLFRLLSRHRPAEEAVYLGDFPLRSGSGQKFACGGSGSVLSRRALHAMDVPRCIRSFASQCLMSDWMIGQCSEPPFASERVRRATEYACDTCNGARDANHTRIVRQRLQRDECFFVSSVQPHWADLLPCGHAPAIAHLRGRPPSMMSERDRCAGASRSTKPRHVAGNRRH